ncbi:pyridoxamine 5'-phosphate oxidase family protein [Methylocystis sp. H4A]|uniref:pyridoxamine 5'-phosphate oxidase family protein n=1 Tax=Methylocystis sp. H4A TaxID=2785788 RepID=UPI0018C2EDC4|nr:pyridoxamine 5'-phosphate oxidase family protein [Methylocystis sp. H4A]MBG0800718.1 pyridoxamine 5'-phosphate oxidase family protein [Methylocystis sp. H4A]
MSKFYGAEHRKLQDEFDTRRLADLMEGGVMHAEFAPHEVEFIQSRDMFFLSTLDPAGRPTVSYKGGAPGFVRVVGQSSLIFPWFDGNGMFYSAGNLAETSKVGLLFIDFVTPNRLRVQGEARLMREASLLASYPGALFVVGVEVESMWVNCPRYIHRYEKITESKYVAAEGDEAPLPGWKRIDIVQEALPSLDRERVEAAGGVIDQAAYGDLLAKGEA